MGITILVLITRDETMPIVERLLSCLCFVIMSILVSISFSKTLFKKTVRSKKTAPFILKFVLMTLCLAVGYQLMNKVFCFAEYKGLFNSTYFLDNNISFLQALGESIPGIMSANIIFCVILLYYEYSQLQNANLEFQLKILHAQINPHFMFNVLNYLHVLMQKDTDLASDLLLKYSDVLRYQLYSGKRDVVKLDQEIQFLKDFIDVEKFRWEDKLDVNCSWIIENPHMDIPPLLLIPFIENAFKHVSRSTFNKGFINIAFEQKGCMVYLEVENSKSDKPVKKNTSTGIGLKNIKARLDLLYGQYYSLIIKETESVYLSKLKIHL